MSKRDFFTRHSAKPKRPRAETEEEAKVNRAKRLGLRAVEDLNPSAVHPNMKPRGPKDPDLYILGEAPSENDDLNGKPFVGKAGIFLQVALPRDHADWTVFDNVCRTRPPKDRTPTPSEIEAFRESVEEEIVRRKPKAILALGGSAWSFFDDATKITTVRGMAFSIRVRDFPVWVVPTLHPSFILRVRNATKKDEGWAGKEWEEIWHRDIAKAVALSNGKTKPTTLPDDPRRVLDAAKLLHGRNAKVADVVAVLDEVAKAGVAAFDIETVGTRPYGPDAKILSISFAWKNKAAAIALDHPSSGWSEADRKKIDAALAKFLKTTTVPLIAHNAGFEIEWLAKFYGVDVARARRWDDTMAAAYVLGNKPSTLSLDFLSLQYFGIRLKTLVPVAVENLISESIEKVLRYNVLDSYFALHLATILDLRLRQEKMFAVYERQVRRIPTLVLAQLAGMPVDQKRVAELRASYGDKIVAVQDEIQKSPEGRIFARKNSGPFNPGSPADVGRFVSEILGRREVVDRAGNFLTDESVLEPIAQDEPLVGKILEYRKLAKIKGTYLDKYVIGRKGAVVWPDGNTHTNFKHTFTDTGRLSSADPNEQNQPARGLGQDVRSARVAPDGFVVVEFDYGQIEARVIGMASNDKRYINALWTGFDIHMDWAEKFAKRDKRLIERWGGTMKGLRSKVKNGFTFPVLYRAGVSTIANGMEVDERIARDLREEFLDYFRGARAWQEELDRQYAEDFFVSSLFGRRFRGPLQYTQIANFPIQSTASDIVIEGMDRLSELAQKTDRPELQPRLNVHDSLTLILPKKNLDDLIEEVVVEMLSFNAPWLNCPLTIEGKVGPDWFNLEEIGTFSTQDLFPKRKNPFAV